MGLRPGDLTDEQFVSTFAECGYSPQAMHMRTGIALSPIYARLNKLRAKGFNLPTIARKGAGINPHAPPARAYQQRVSVDLPDGVAVVFSDAHWWPGHPRTVAHEALLKVLSAPTAWHPNRST
jgi:hypothetical protein